MLGLIRVELHSEKMSAKIRINNMSQTIYFILAKCCFFINLPCTNFTEQDNAVAQKSIDLGQIDYCSIELNCNWLAFKKKTKIKNCLK